MTALSKAKSKRFLGFELLKIQDLNRVWVNSEKVPLVCISHKKTWLVSVSVGGQRFEAEGPTETKARSNFMSHISQLKDTLSTIESWSKRR